MSAFEEWLDDCIKMNKLEDDAALSPDDYCYNLDFVKEAFQDGRAYQREVDAKIAAGRPYIWSHEVAKAIREQKID